jgi:hypothetical protein
MQATSLPATLSPEEHLDNLQVKRHLAEFFGKEDLNDKPIGVGVRLCYVRTDVSNLHFLVRQRERTKGVHHFPTLQFSRRFTTHEPGLIPQDAFVLPDKALVDELIRKLRCGSRFVHLRCWIQRFFNPSRHIRPV